jgi:peptidoglycan/xylan/chitin deacetylase (PgdA/CDA1 family)
MPLVATFGPDRLPSALVLTIDNLGEARALERGTQPPDAPVGDDPSVTVALPWLLDELESHRLSATFFVEAINTELYPDALKRIAARGHGLGLHGWRHEEWTSLSAAEEREVFTRSVPASARRAANSTRARRRCCARRDCAGARRPVVAPAFATGSRTSRSTGISSTRTT